VPERHESDLPAWFRQFDGELIGLDREDPEAQAFAAHLEHMQQTRPTFTVEGYLHGVSEFADSVNRTEGGRRWGAVLVVLLILLGAAYVAWQVLEFVLTTWM
jgi:hypothetical protein